MADNDEDVPGGADKRDRSESDELSAVEQARLAQWFGAAAFVEPHLTDRAAQANATTDSTNSIDAGREAPDSGLTRHERWQRAEFELDPVLVADLERRETEADSFRAQTGTLAVSSDTFASMTGVEKWQFSDAAERRDTERPWELAGLLAEVTPQAVLRDLHRPVKDFGAIQLEPTLLGTGAGSMLNATAAGHTIMTTRYRIDINDFPTAAVPISADLHDLRTRLNEPWGELQFDPQTKAELTTSEIRALQMKWFG